MHKYNPKKFHLGCECGAAWQGSLSLPAPLHEVVWWLKSVECPRCKGAKKRRTVILNSEEAYLTWSDRCTENADPPADEKKV